MDKDKLISEIETLNNQLSAIEEREQKQKVSEEPSTEEPNIEEIEDTKNDVVSEIYQQIEHRLKLNDDMKNQLKKLVKEVELQFEELPKAACMSIFTAGIILGKVLK